MLCAPNVRCAVTTHAKSHRQRFRRTRLTQLELIRVWADLVHFGLIKAIMNFVTGLLADRYGRRTTMLIGWLAALPMPMAVLWADSWASVSATNLLLGLQQAICWSTSIFIMIDCAGKENGGLAVGLNETSGVFRGLQLCVHESIDNFCCSHPFSFETAFWGTGYVALALMNLIAPLLLDENEPRGACYYAVMVFVSAGLLVTAIFMKDTSHLLDSDKPASSAVDSDSNLSKELQQQADTSPGKAECAVVELPGGGKERVNVSIFAFVYTSFMKPQLMVINLAGLTVNFIAAMAWGLLLQWLKQGSGGWAALDKASIASITMAYDLTKGLGQFGCGFLGDRLGRKPFIVGGLGVYYPFRLISRSARPSILNYVQTREQFEVL